MDEDVTDQTAGAPQSGPAAAAGGATVIEAFPGELGAGGAIARAVAHVEIEREKPAPCLRRLASPRFDLLFNATKSRVFGSPDRRKSMPSYTG